MNKYSEKYIYKITNKVTGKIYIGQAVDPELRFQQHCQKKEKYVSLINQAIQKYGKENFSFEIIGKFIDYNEKEKYYIKFYNTISPNGYNLTEGGEKPPILKGENNPASKLNDEIVWKIQYDLLDEKNLRKDIVKKYNLTEDEIRHIIAGDCWRRENFDYPLRRQEKELNQDKVREIIDLLLNSSLTQKEIAEKVGWTRLAITMINIGQNHYQDGINYPIRKGRVCKRNSKQS